MSSSPLGCDFVTSLLTALKPALGRGYTTTQCFIKHLFVSMSVKQNLFV